MHRGKQSAIVREKDQFLVNPTLPVAHDDGHFISERVSRLVEIIRERWPVVDVKWIPPELRGVYDDAFLIVENLPDGRTVPIFRVKNEQEFDGSVLERLIQSDNANGNVHNAIEAQNEAVRLIQKKLEKEQREEAHDLAGSILKSPLHTYRHKMDNGRKLVIKDYGNREA